MWLSCTAGEAPAPTSTPELGSFRFGPPEAKTPPPIVFVRAIEKSSFALMMSPAPDARTVGWRGRCCR
jgi:hypothetical protein